jgi:hypothetical protein
VPLAGAEAGVPSSRLASLPRRSAAALNSPPPPPSRDLPPRLFNVSNRLACPSPVTLRSPKIAACAGAALAAGSGRRWVRPPPASMARALLRLGALALLLLVALSGSPSLSAYPVTTALPASVASIGLLHSSTWERMSVPYVRQ